MHGGSIAVLKTEQNCALINTVIGSSLVVTSSISLD